MNPHIYQLLIKNKNIELIKIILNYAKKKRLSIFYFDEINDLFINRFNYKYNYVNDILTKDEIIKYMNNQNILGWCDNNKIYIKRDISQKIKLATICHEFIHLIINANNKYEKEKDIFREEYIADIAYNMIYYNINISNIIKHKTRISKIGRAHV